MARQPFEYGDGIFVTAVITERASGQSRAWTVKITEKQQTQLLYETRAGRKPPLLSFAFAHLYCEALPKASDNGGAELVNLFFKMCDLEFILPTDGHEMHKSTLTFGKKMRLHDEAIDLTQHAIRH